MSIRFGVSPIAWINDDMPELGGDTPVARVLEEARDLGFSGIELGDGADLLGSCAEARCVCREVDLRGLIVAGLAEQIVERRSADRLLETADASEAAIVEQKNNQLGTERDRRRKLGIHHQI